MTATGAPSENTTTTDGCLYFPKEDTGEDQPLTFVQACLLAAETHRPLHLLEDVSNLSETIVLRKRQSLTIVGSPTRRKISGYPHSLFLLNNHSQLKLVNLKVLHQDDNDEDCRTMGAAVNLRYKSKVWIEGSEVKSEVGFCCWAVQKSSVFFDRAYLEAPMRSAMVCFGQTHLEGRSSTIANVGVHGVCARGDCLLRLTDCSILGAAVRGLYAYANATVQLEACTVRGTVRSDMAAIEVASSSSMLESGSTGKKTSSLAMNECCIVDNGGVGVRIRGGVLIHNHLDGTSNRFLRNQGGNEVEFLPSISKEDENMDPKKTSKPLQRDASMSSFRKGDWWCIRCIPKRIVPGSKVMCPACGLQKTKGKYLSNDEVIRLNRGDVSDSTNTNGSSNSSKDDTNATWWFDGDDPRGWIPYDDESNRKLESAFRAFCRLDSGKDCGQSGRTVLLSAGKYKVNLETMEQINTESHFLRLVKRKEP